MYMFAIVGALIVLGCVVGGFLLEGGNVHILVQPVELLIIGGAAVGSFCIASPPRVLRRTLKGVTHVLSGSAGGKQQYLDLLILCFELATYARREGVLALEPHVNDPGSSEFFSRHKSVVRNKGLTHFLCDNLKVYISGLGMEPHEFEAMMDLDLSSHKQTEETSHSAINTLADGLPGLGIVAAVLGVVLTMEKLNEPPEVLGHHIGAALLGTFLGVLLCYGFVGPLAKNLEHRAKEGEELLYTAKAWLLAFYRSWPPVLTVELARRAIPSDERPLYEELEQAVRGG